MKNTNRSAFGADPVVAAQRKVFGGEYHGQRLLYISGEIDDDMALALDRALATLRTSSDEPVHIVMNSGGGEVMAGLAMHDSIMRAVESDVSVRMLVQGHAMSMAAVVLQAASERYITPSSYLMHHQVSAELYGGTSGIERDAKFISALEDTCNRILASRSKVSLEDIVAHQRDGNWYLNAKQAVRAGFVDRIMSQ